MTDLIVGQKNVMVHRVVLESLPPVDPHYNYTELEIEGQAYRFSNPDAQALGQLLNRAAGGPS